MFENFFGRFYSIFIERGGWNLLAEGMKNTLLIAAAALLIGVLFGTLFAVIKVIPKINLFVRLLHLAADAYIAVFRGTPVVVQLLLFYFGIFSPLGANPLLVAILVFGLNSSAYVAEIVRSGILAVDKGQFEAGRSLGLSYAVTMRKIILPQAIKNIIPALGNEMIVLIKETSIAGFVTVTDLTRQSQSLAAQTYDVIVPYFTLAAVYLVIVLIATFAVNRLERWMRRSDHR